MCTTMQGPAGAPTPGRKHEEPDDRKRHGVSESLGDRLRQYRLLADLTLEALSQASGISDRTISNIERGVSTSPQRRTLSALLDALGLTADQQQELLRLARLPRLASGPSSRSAMLAPTLVTDFTGRPGVMAEIETFLRGTDDEDSPTVLVVCGAAGVGKTTVALEALRRHEYEDCARAFVDLDGMDAMPLPPLGVLQALIAQTSDVRDTPTLDEAILEWRRTTAAQRVAVVLDDAASEEQVRPVLTAANVVVVVTSRRSLSGLTNVRRITLESLDRAESTQLIGRIVPARQRTDEDTDHLAAACGDLPLALRIAANRIAAQPRSTVRDFLERMAARREPLRALVAGDLAVENALALSYDQIDAGSRRLFRSLSLIDGPTFDASLAAAATAADPDETGDRLDELTDLGLVEARGGNRYHLHDLVKLFAAARSRREDTDVAGQRTALRHWVLHTTRNAGLWFERDRRPDPRAPGRHFADADHAASWLRTEGSQWVTAVQQASAMGEDRLVLDTAEALHWFSDTWPAWDLWRTLFLTSAEVASRSGSDRDMAVHLGYAAWVHLLDEAFDDARRSADAAVAAALRADDRRELGWARFYLAWTLGRQQDFPAGLTTATSALEDLVAAGDQEGVAQVLALTGNLMARTGQLQEAVDRYRRILELLEERRDALPANIVLVTGTTTRTALAMTMTTSGDPRYALESMPDVIRESEAADYDDGAARAHVELARAARATGDTERFEEHISVARRIATDHRLLHLLPRIDDLLGEPAPAMITADGRADAGGA